MRAQKASVFVKIAVEERLTFCYQRKNRPAQCGAALFGIVICVHLDTCADTGISGKIFLMKKNRL